MSEVRDPPMARVHVGTPAAEQLTESRGSGGIAIAPLPRPAVEIGRFVVLERLGAGGMAVVHAAYDAVLDRRVALKLIADEADDPEQRGRLLREAQALAKLSHPNVVQVYDAGTFAHGVYIAMELVRGQTLRGWCSASPRPRGELIAMFVAAGRGLAAAHEVGIVHRDFKPDNVLVGEGRARVADFGLARSLDATEHEQSASGHGHGDASGPLTSVGTVVGTPAYMAPEQHLGVAIDERADQFAFCVALYEALYGERPFVGGSIPELAVAVIEGVVRPPPAGQRVPRRIRALLLRGLAVDPAQRHASMTSLLDALERDPIRTARRAGLAALALAGSVALSAYAADAPPRCVADTDAFAGIWDAPRRASLAAALVRDDRPWSAAAFERLGARIDERNAAWIAMRHGSCVATHVDGVQSQELLDLRTACLDRERDELAALLTALDDAPSEAIDRPDAVVGELGPLAPCADPAWLTALVRPPEDPVVAAQVSELAHRLDDAAALAHTLRPEPALANLRGLIEPVVATGHAPLVAELRVHEAALLGRTGDAAGAQRAWLAGIDAAALAGDDRLGARALTQLAWSHARSSADPHAADTLVRLAAATVTRTGDDADLLDDVELLRGHLAYVQGDYPRAQSVWQLALDRARTGDGERDDAITALVTNLANLRIVEGDFAAAEHSYRELLARLEQRLGSEHPALVRPLDNLGIACRHLGELDEARRFHERALAIGVRALGPGHPQLAPTLIDLGLVHFAANELDLAEQRYREALVIDEAALGPDHPDVAGDIDSLGTVARARGRLAEARSLHERSLAIRERALGADHAEVATSLVNLGSVLLAQGEGEPALRVLARALAIDEAARGTDSPVLLDSLLAIAEAQRMRHHEDDAQASLRRAEAIAARAPDDVDPVLASRLQRALAATPLPLR